MYDDLEQAPDAHEQFVCEAREIDQAFANGSLDQWVSDKVEYERRRYESSDRLQRPEPTTPPQGAAELGSHETGA